MVSQHSVERLQGMHDFSYGSIGFLRDKGFGDGDFGRLCEAMEMTDETFAERRNRRSRIEVILDRGDAMEMTDGRYERYVNGFREISSEQALVRGRMRFAVEYVIALADHLIDSGVENGLVSRKFNVEEKEKLRSIYRDFRTKDFVAAKLIEGKTNHDIVAANTWLTIRAQQLGIDGDLMRGAIHFARTSSDVNTNVTGYLYMNALGEWTDSLSRLVSILKDKAREYKNVSCVARTHGQDAQLTTLGHIYANLADQIRQHAKPLLGDQILRLDGKIGGAIGTDVDMHAAFPGLDFEPMYRRLVEEQFLLNYVDTGIDQDCSNAALCTVLDTMVNVGNVVKKAATDTWLYASRGLLAKLTTVGESGSSVMPQKANPFLAEGCEALISIVAGMITPIKEMVVAYREQGDLRRSITKRAGFHPVMLSVIGIERLIGELKNYEPSVAALEAEIYERGPQIVSSAVQTYLRGRGVSKAYDAVKEIVMRPRVRPDEITTYIEHLVSEGHLGDADGRHVMTMIGSVMDEEGLLEEIYGVGVGSDRAIVRLEEINRDVGRRSFVLGKAVAQTERMVETTRDTIGLLSRYSLAIAS